MTETASVENIISVEQVKIYDCLAYNSAIYAN